MEKPPEGLLLIAHSNNDGNYEPLIVVSYVVGTVAVRCTRRRTPHNDGEARNAGRSNVTDHTGQHTKVYDLNSVRDTGPDATIDRCLLHRWAME